MELLFGDRHSVLLNVLANSGAQHRKRKDIAVMDGTLEGALLLRGLMKFGARTRKPRWWQFSACGLFTVNHRLGKQRPQPCNDFERQPPRK